MAPTPWRRHLLLGAAVTLLLAGCGSWWHSQQRALQERIARQRCLQQRAAIEQRWTPIRADQQALATLAREQYVPTPGPLPPDPDRASRYSQLDQQLDQERYVDQLTAWRQRERQRQQRWQRNQSERRQRLQAQLAQKTAELAAVDQSLVVAGKPDAAQIARLTSCGASAR